MSDLPRDFEYEYRVVWRFDSWCHMWIVHGPKGSIHFHFTDMAHRNIDATAGLEIHYRTPPPYMAMKAPNQPQCAILHAPCWHDGTSLYASEHLLPMVMLTQPLEFFVHLVGEMKRFDEEESDDGEG